MKKLSRGGASNCATLLEQFVRLLTCADLKKRHGLPLAPGSPEFQAMIDEFVDDMLGDDRTSFTFEEATQLAVEMGYSPAAVKPAIDALKAAGLDMEKREPGKHIRGFKTNSNDRWYGPGSCPSHGGSGAEEITGFSRNPAGLKGWDAVRNSQKH